MQIDHASDQKLTFFDNISLHLAVFRALRYENDKIIPKEHAFALNTHETILQIALLIQKVFLTNDFYISLSQKIIRIFFQCNRKPKLNYNSKQFPQILHSIEIFD